MLWNLLTTFSYVCILVAFYICESQRFAKIFKKWSILSKRISDYFEVKFRPHSCEFFAKIYLPFSDPKNDGKSVFSELILSVSCTLGGSAKMRASLSRQQPSFLDESATAFVRFRIHSKIVALINIQRFEKQIDCHLARPTAHPSLAYYYICSSLIHTIFMAYIQGGAKVLGQSLHDHCIKYIQYFCVFVILKYFPIRALHYCFWPLLFIS